MEFTKGNGKLTTPIEPPHRVCKVCNDDGKCLDNVNHPDYKENNQDFFGTDYLDCVNYLEKKNSTQGEFIKGYIKNLQEEEKTKEPYESDFVKWSKRHSK